MNIHNKAQIICCEKYSIFWKC